MGCGTKYAGWIWATAIALTVFGLIPWGLYELEHSHKGYKTEFWFAAAVFVTLTVPISGWDVAMHLRHYENPQLQRCIIRIILMVPIYAVDAWFGLRFPEQAIYFDTVRECYEAYVIYNFYALLLGFVKQVDPDFLSNALFRKQRPHMFPMKYCLKPWTPGPNFFYWIRTGPIVYIFGRVFLTVIALICEATDTYNDGEFGILNPWCWIAGINTLTQGWAMYCLVLFYYEYKEELAAASPVPKLLVIKAVVFFTFWQSCGITFLGLKSVGVIESINKTVCKETGCHRLYLEEAEDFSYALNDLLICIEMFIFACLHHYIFSYKEFAQEGMESSMTFKETLAHLMRFDDVTDDVVGGMKAVGGDVLDATRDVFRQGFKRKQSDHEAAADNTMREPLIENEPTATARDSLNTSMGSDYGSAH